MRQQAKIANRQSEREARGYMAAAIKGYRGRFALALGIRSLLAVSVAVLALLTQAVVDGAVALSLRRVMIYGGMILALVLARTALSTAATAMEGSLRKRINMGRRQTLLLHLLCSDTASSERFHSGLLMERIYQDMDAVTNGMLSIPNQLLSGVLQLLVSVGALLVLDWRLTALLAVAGLALFLGAKLYRRVLQGRYGDMRAANEQSYAYYQETMEHRTVIKAFQAESKAVERAKAGEDRFYGIWAKWRNVQLLTGASLGLFYQLGYFAALILCAYKVYQNHISFGEMTAVLQLVSNVQSPFASLSGLLPRYYASLASARRLLALEGLPLEQSGAPADEAAVRALYDELTGLRAEGLGFRYQRERVLEPSSFFLPKGSFVLITGQSGAGKSTLFKLLLGLYPATEGTLCFETRTKSRTIAPKWRGMFAYVPQGNLLLSGTLRENLVFLCGERSDEDIRQALEISCADFVEELPDGLSTVIGENGLGLSEGQAQRISIARGLLSHAPILLLDEATSALDVATEKRLLGNLRALQDRTVLFISHKAEAYGVCDVELRVRDGVAACAAGEGAAR